MIRKILDKFNYSHYFNKNKFKKVNIQLSNLTKKIANWQVELVKEYRNFVLQISLWVLAIIWALLYNIDKLRLLKDFFLIKNILFWFLIFILFSFLFLVFTYAIDTFYIKKIQTELSKKIQILSEWIIKINKFNFWKSDAEKLNNEIKKPISKVWNKIVILNLILSIIAFLWFAYAIVYIFILVYNL